MLTAPGGYPMRAKWAPMGTGLELSSEHEARGAVRSLVQRGAAVIKVALNPPVGPTLEGLLLGAIVDEAHRCGLKVTGHVHGLDELDKSIHAGIDELAHMLMSDEKIPDATIETMVSSNLAIVSTLSIRYGHDLSTAIDNLRRFRNKGGNVVYGTDLGNEGPRPGIDPREIEGLERAGLAPIEIIAAATARAAEWLGLERVGALSEGMDADLIAVRGDPTKDLSALFDVVMVWRRGVRVR